jgi:hypothetical protein
MVPVALTTFCISKGPTPKQTRSPVIAYRVNPLFPNHFEQPQDWQPE